MTVIGQLKRKTAYNVLRGFGTSYKCGNSLYYSGVVRNDLVSCPYLLCIVINFLTAIYSTTICLDRFLIVASKLVFN